MPNTLANLARMTTATTGTGTITLGQAVEGFLAFADELSSGDVITYAIEDGNQREIGQGTFTVSGAIHTLTRSTVYASTQGGAQISLSGSAQVFVTAAAEDFASIISSAERSKLTKTGAFAYQTRTAFVSDLVTVSALANAGDVVTAGRRQYVYVSGSTAIGDLADWEPLDDVTPDHWGIATGTDETTDLQAMLRWASQNGRTVVWPAGAEYWFTRLILTDAVSFHWRVEGAGTCDLKSIKTSPDGNGDADYAILMRGQFLGSDDGTADMAMGSDIVTIADTTGYEVGDLIQIRSTRLNQSDNQGTNREGQTAKVRRIVSGTQLAITATAQALYKHNDTLTGAIQTVNSTTSLVLAASIDRPERDMLLKMTLTSGANNGQVRYITGWDNGTKTATFDVAWPSGTLASDTYLIEWTYEVVQTRPARVHLEPGLRLYRDEHLNATAGDEGFVGLKVQECRDGLIDGIIIENFSTNCLRIQQCYRIEARNPTVEGANRAFGTFNGTGYGIAINQSWMCGVVGGHSHRCRRGIDFGGAQQINWYGYCRDYTVYGGGKTYENNDFFPTGTQFSEGFGSHGPANGTLYQNCKAVDCYNAVNLRGVRERVIDCAHYGAGGDYSVLLRTGGGHIIDGYVYDDLFSEIGVDSTARYQTQSDGSQRCFHLIRVATGASDGCISSLPLQFTNITASKLIQSVIDLRGSGQAPPIAFGQIRAWASDEDEAQSTFLFVREDGAPKTVNHLTDLGGNKVTFDGTEYTDYQFVQWNADVRPAKGYQEVQAAKSYVVVVADDAVAQVPMDNGVIKLDLFDMNNAGTYFANAVIMKNNSSTNFAPTDQRTLVDLSTSVLAGTTGADGRVTLAYKPSGGNAVLYIENRMGYEMNALLTVTAIPSL